MNNSSTTSTSEEFNGPAVAAVLIVEMILALIANGVVLSITLYQRKSLKQPSTIFFTSLILAHLVLNLLYLPFTIIALAAGEWIFGSTDEEKRRTCAFASYLYWFIIAVISMTLAAISFDRFLFIVKPHLHKRFMRPWVALTLTIAIWILSAVLISFSFFIFKREYNPHLCVLISRSSNEVYLFIVVTFIIISIIVVTSIWTLCATCSCTTNRSLTSGESVYSSRRHLGVFSCMLIVYGVCYIPGIIEYLLGIFYELPLLGDSVGIVFFLFITVANPVVQSYFRPDIKTFCFSHCPLLSACLCCSCVHNVF